MKPIMVSLIVLLTSNLFAQDGSEGATPESGNLFIEITTSPLNRDASGDALLSFGQFRARYVLNETLVPRLGIYYSIDDNKNGMSTPDVTEKLVNYMFTPGIEYHFLNENGFSSYAALDVVITGRAAEVSSSTGPSVAGAVINPNFLTDPNAGISFQQRGFFGLGGYLAAGADYHFSSRFYMGAEIGFFFNTGKSSDVEIDGTLYQEGIKFFDSGIQTANSFRIGFKLL